MLAKARNTDDFIYWSVHKNLNFLSFLTDILVKLKLSKGQSVIWFPRAKIKENKFKASEENKYFVDSLST